MQCERCTTCALTSLVLPTPPGWEEFGEFKEDVVRRRFLVLRGSATGGSGPAPLSVLPLLLSRLWLASSTAHVAGPWPHPHSTA